MKQPASILWISAVGEKGGAEVYMLNLLRHLDRSRFAPAVALLRPGPLQDELAEMQIPTFLLRPHRMRNLPAVFRTILHLAKIAKEHRFDLIHSNGFRTHVYGGCAAALGRIPAVWSVHTVEKSGLATAGILRIPAKRALANCPRTARFFANHGHFTNLIWPGVDKIRLQQQTPKEALAKRYSLPLGARWVSMGARLQRYKGHEHFIRALASLPPEMSDVHGIIIGGTLFGMEQAYRSEMLKLTDGLGMTPRIRFPGFISDADVYGFLAASELLVHPALEEDFGLIVAEAQALGRAVVAFATVGPAAIVEDQETGRLIPIGDQAQLNSTLASLLARPELLQTWGQAGRKRALRLFAANTGAEQLETIYNACLSSV